MVEEGIKICSQAYWKIQQDPRLNKLATDKLDEAVMLCNAIAHPRVGKQLTIKDKQKQKNGQRKRKRRRKGEGEGEGKI